MDNPFSDFLNRVQPFHPSQCRAVFIAAIEKIHTDEDLGEGLLLTESIRLTNNPEVYKKVIPLNALFPMGAIELSGLLNIGILAYNHQLPTNYATDQQAVDDVVENLFKLRLWFRALWLVRDNAVFTEMGYVIHYPQPHPNCVTGSRNFFSHIFTRHDGTMEPTTFSGPEIRMAVRLFREFGFDRFRRDSARDSGRIWRAFYFIESARANNDLAVRVANYMTAFESLFTTSRNKITEKLATRVACFLESKPNRAALAALIKKAYGIRCEAVHGDPVFSQQSLLKGDITDKVERLKEASALCDDLLRKCILKILTRPDLAWLFMAREGKLEASTQEFDNFMADADSKEEAV